MTTQRSNRWSGSLIVMTAFLEDPEPSRQLGRAGFWISERRASPRQ
jgi:hypothetical protein